MLLELGKERWPGKILAISASRVQRGHGNKLTQAPCPVDASVFGNTGSIPFLTNILIVYVSSHYKKNDITRIFVVPSGQFSLLTVKRETFDCIFLFHHQQQLLKLGLPASKSLSS